MNPRHLLIALLITTFSALHAAETKRPNVLFLALDDLNHWVGYTGRNPQAKTPNLDRLAARSVAFTHAYCAAPVCNPSRAALMSGLRPSTSGVYENYHDGRAVIPTDLDLTSTFRKAGYFVCGTGKIFHESYQRPEEWDEYGPKTKPDPAYESPEVIKLGGIKFGPLDITDDQMPDWKVANYGIAQLGKAHDKPFFLAVGIKKPHLPFCVPRKWFDLFPLAGIELPPHMDGDLDDIPKPGVALAHSGGDHRAILAANKWKEAVQAYLATIAYADMLVGRLLDALDASAYKDNTIICLWGDHGWSLGEKEHWRKFALWEEPTRMPFLWSVPGVTKPGVCARTVELMSVYPTLCELCGISTPKHVEARSIVPLLRDPQAAWEHPALTTYGFQNHTVRTEQWRLIRYANGSQELYDEQADPFEYNNLATDPAHKATKQTLATHFPKVNHEPLPTDPKAEGAEKAVTPKREGTTSPEAKSKP